MFSFFVLSAVSEQKNHLISVYYNVEKKTFSYDETRFDETAYARGAFSESLNETGWNELQVEFKADISNVKLSSYAAGYAEGRLTGHLFNSHYKHVLENLCRSINCENGKLPKTVYDYLDALENNVKNAVQIPTGDLEAGASIYEQIQGIYKGYSEVVKEPISYQEFWSYLCQSMVYDFARNQHLTKDPNPPPLIRRGSSFIALSPDLEDVFFAHSSWRPYNEMQRIAKRYRFRYENSEFTQRRAFSSAPLMPFSDDTFVITDSNKILMSTPLGSSKTVVEAAKNTNNGFPHWFRANLALLVAHSAPDFYNVYKNDRTVLSGVQYVIVDLEKINYKKHFFNDFVWYIDEIPGTDENALKGSDESDDLNIHDFVASYSIPRTPKMYKAAGYPEIVETFHSPELFSLSDSAPERIFKRDAIDIAANAPAKRLIRFNDPTDEIQNGSTINTVAGRYDLEEDAAKAGCWGAYDSKFTTLPRALHLMWEGQNGPSHEDLPVFKFQTGVQTNACSGYDEEGLPNEFGFGWSEHYFDIQH